jgi:NADPH:quinone reductase-like Zn-dependent oxidoreductase
MHTPLLVLAQKIRTILSKYITRSIKSIYWFPRLADAAKQDLIDEIIARMREGVLVTSAALKFSLNEIDAAVRQAESKGRQGKVLLVPMKKD